MVREDAEREYYRAYAKGWITKLDECTTGRNVHETAQLKQVLYSSLSLLARDSWRDCMPTLRAIVTDAGRRSRPVYRRWLGLNQ